MQSELRLKNLYELIVRSVCVVIVGFVSSFLVITLAEGKNVGVTVNNIRESKSKEEHFSQDAIEANQKNAKKWYLMGYTYARQLEFIQMKQAFHKAIELNQQFRNKGIEIERDSGTHFRAEDGIDKISRAVWTNAFLNGVRYFSDALASQKPSLRTHNFEQAVAFFETATIIAPDSVLAFRNLAAALMNMSRYSDSIEPLKKALGLSPHDNEIRAMLDSVTTFIARTPARARQTNSRAPVISIFEPEGAQLVKEGQWLIEVPITDSDSLVLRGIIVDDTGIVELKINDHRTLGFAKTTRGQFHLAIPVMSSGELLKVQLVARDIEGNTSLQQYSIIFVDKNERTKSSQPNALAVAPIKEKDERNNTMQAVLYLSFISIAATGLTLYLIPHVLSFNRSDRRNGRPTPPLPLPNCDEQILKGMGKTWAVLIANSKYLHWPDLQEQPYEDVAKFKRTLKQYRFDQIIETRDLRKHEFEPYLESIFSDMQREHVCSLLLYYAGHGEYNPLLDRGYWIPIDADTDNVRLGYLDDQKIKDYVKLYTQQASHVLLLADCCFSGHLLRCGPLHKPTEPDLHHLRIDAAHKSAAAITSGRKEERVLNQSLFSKILVDILSRNTEAYLRDEDIAYQVTKRVREVSKHQQPQFDRFAETDEFGKFIFIKKT